MAGDHGSLITRARVLIVGAGLLIAVAGVFAVARGPGAGGCMDETGIPGFAGGGRYPIFDDLDLTAGQREAWVGAWQTHLDEMRPTLDRLKELRRDLRAELASESPDPATVGRYVIALRELAATVGAARTDLDASLTGILDVDQRTRYRALRAANGGAG